MSENGKYEVCWLEMSPKMKRREQRKQKQRDQAKVLGRASGYADKLRANATAAEKRLRNLLIAHRISHVFQSHMCDTRSKVIYIADFRIRRPGRGRLFVEVDGSYHDGRGEYDARRTDWIRDNRDGEVLRFTNEEVFQNSDSVIARILEQRPAIKSGHAAYSKANAARRFLGLPPDYPVTH